MYGRPRCRKMARRTSKLIIAWGCFCTLLALTLEAQLIKKPWFAPPYKFRVGSDVDVSFFSDVENGFNPLGYRSTNVDWALFALIPFQETVDFQIEANFQRTSAKDFNFQTLVGQLRKQFLSDVRGDPISLCWGFNYRYVSKSRLSDVATPYHNVSNFELTAALGKEWANDFQWYLRTFLWGGAGQANVGSPWARFDFNIQGKSYGNYLIGGGAKGYFGFGGERGVNVSQFSSYARIHHQSVDVYAQFGYLSTVWGSLVFRYLYRPYARSFPDQYNAFMLSYTYPFSF